MTGIFADLADTVARLKAPSRVVDFEIQIAVFGDAIWPATDMQGRITNPDSRMSDYLSLYRDVIDRDDQDFDFPRYTTSLDAAMMLVPEGAEWEVTNLYGIAQVNMPLNAQDGWETTRREDGSVILAFVECCLRARAASVLQNKEGCSNG